MGLEHLGPYHQMPNHYLNDFGKLLKGDTVVGKNASLVTRRLKTCPPAPLATWYMKTFVINVTLQPLRRGSSKLRRGSNPVYMWGKQVELLRNVGWSIGEIGGGGRRKDTSQNIRCYSMREHRSQSSHWR